MFRKIIFWAHLTGGVAAGLVILMMAVTGVILTYERQILAADARNYPVEAPEGQARLTADRLLEVAETSLPFEPRSLVVSPEPGAPVVLRAGRRERAALNPYTGAVVEIRNQSLEDFFSTVTGLHRWFNVSGDGRDVARQITGVSNLVFLFLIVTGLYLWLPRVYRWGAFRLRLWFRKAPNAAARDFNWHHVLGLWSAVPLLVIVATATVFNYAWASDLLYQLAGDEPPRPGAATPASASAEEARDILPLEALLERGKEHAGSWNSLTMALPAPGSHEVNFTVDRGNGGQPQKRHGLVLNGRTGELVRREPFDALPASRQARSWVRFLHTGEALGPVGQTVAGLASLAAAVMVWTGLALAYRRLRRHLEGRNRVREHAAAR